MGKYDPLEAHLRALDQARFNVTFETIESIIGEALPTSSSIYREWWSNEENGTHVQAHAWVQAGWRVEFVDLDGRRVEFVRW